MSDFQSPDPPSPIKPPRCFVCGKAMRLESAAPSPRYINLRQATFVCDCGWTSDQLLAEKD